jgi:hypothetical protein
LRIARRHEADGSLTLDRTLETTFERFALKDFGPSAAEAITIVQPSRTNVRPRANASVI